MLRLAVMLEDGKSKVEEVTGQKNPDSPLHLAALSEAADTADTNSSATGTEIKTGTGNYAPHSSELSPVFPLGRAASLLLAMLEPPDRSYVNRCSHTILHPNRSSLACIPHQSHL